VHADAVFESAQMCSYTLVEKIENYLMKFIGRMSRHYYLKNRQLSTFIR
jgi:hypothetical protein